MAKVRVYQLAKELQVHSALILELLDRLGQEVKSDLSVLESDTADLVRQKVTFAIEAERRRLQEAAETQPTAEAEPTPAETEPTPSEVGPAEAAATPSAEPAAVAAAGAAHPPAVDPAARGIPARAPAITPPRSSAPPAAPASGRPADAAASSAAGLPPQRPRVFAARRLVPHPSVVKTAAARAAAAAAATAGRTTSPVRPAGPVPAQPPPTTFTAGPKPKRRKKNDPEERSVMAQLAARPKPDLPPVPAEITLSEAVTVKELAEKLNRKSKDVIAKLITRGVLANINQPLDPTMAIEVASEFGSVATVMTFEEEAQKVVTPEVTPGETAPVDRPEDLSPRSPVVTVMGHVDHGKTSLLDAIRETRVVEGEAGGITQHIGAYQVQTRGRSITFLDTPGHEAFTLMRARGAKVTDIVVLVVAADDGVKPQTIEAIDHARAAEVPIVVAINKIDKPNAVPERVKQQLADRGLVVEEYGGDTVCCAISAKKRDGIDALLDMVHLVADLKDLKANPAKPATGVVLETKLDRARGIISTVLVQDGTLKIGDAFIAGAAYGKVRAMADDRGRRVAAASPSMPVELMGFAGEPVAGDSFQTVVDEAKARQIASFRQEKHRQESQVSSSRRTLESLSRDVAEGEIKELPVILKADSQGAIEALQKSLGELPSDKIRVRLIRASIGAISQADVLLASASSAIIVGFNARHDRQTADLAKQMAVELRLYTVIYDVLDDIKKAMVGMLAPTFKEVVLGQAEVRQLFKVPKVGTVAGCYVTDGKVARSAEVRLLRDHIVIYTGKVGSLRRFKDDVSEVKQGFECGIGIQNYNDLKDGDVIEFFTMEKLVAQSL